MRSTVVIIAMLLLACALVTALAVPLAASPGPLRCVPLGLASAQVILAAAAVVLLRRGLWLRLSLLAATLIAWPLLLPTADRTTISIALLGVALVTAAWCGGMRLLGWRVLSSNADEESHLEPAGQFSLATIMLATTSLALYFGWLRTCISASEQNLSPVAVGLAMTLPGCLFLTCLAQRLKMWLGAATVVSLYYAGLVGWPWSRAASGLPADFGAWCTIALTTQLAVIGITVAASLAAGIQLKHVGAARSHAPRGNAPSGRSAASARTLDAERREIAFPRGAWERV